MTVIRPRRAVCRAYSIRPYNRGHALVGITRLYPQPPFNKTTHNMTVIRPRGAVCGAYAVAPLQPGTRLNWDNTAVFLTADRCDMTIRQVF